MWFKWWPWRKRKVTFMRRKLISDLVHEIKAETSRKKKLDIIASNMSPALIGILRLQYDMSVELDVDLNISYRKRKPRDFDVTMSRACKCWHMFTKQAPHSRVRKNGRLKAMLEALEPTEALVFIEAAQRGLGLGLSAAAIEKALPEFFTNLSKGSQTQDGN
jgi:hypothetical protein